MIRNFLLAIFFIISFGPPEGALSSDTNFDHSYKNYDLLLSKHVNNGQVDYAKLKKNSSDLDSIIVEFSGVDKKQFNSWSESKRLAYLINLYNAATLALVAEHYPVASIKDIGKPWDVEIVNLYGSMVSLNHLEHEIIRKKYNEPRIHFALVCAAKGCPELINKAYTGESLNSQLENSTKSFLSLSDKNRIDDSRKEIVISPIFDWFSEDFIKKSGTVVAFIAPYYSKNTDDLKTYQIKYTNYDWSLNDNSQYTNL